MLKRDEPDYKRILLAVMLAAGVLVVWQAQVEWPRRQAMAKLYVAQKQEEKAIAEAKTLPLKNAAGEENANLSHAQRLAASPRVTIASEKLTGSIALTGARFDDLSFTKYRFSVDKDSPNIVLFSPGGNERAYFAQAGWLASDGKTKVPDQRTPWQADKKTLADGDTVRLSWNNGEGVTFRMAISLDRDYMFTIGQTVENHSGNEITVTPYAYVNRVRETSQEALILHQGIVGVMDNTLHEINYKDLTDIRSKTYENTSGWFGLTDHYWLAALIPAEGGNKVTFSHYEQNKHNRYQADYAGTAQTVAAGASAESSLRLFAGAKELRLLDHYATGAVDGKPIILFDRALDFGWFYFLAKPMCLVVDYLFDLTGNFGIALLIFIVIVKIALFPLANKSYKSMAQMREIQPEMLKIRERYLGDQIGMHKAMRDLYKTKKINPAAGCLPILIQIIVFLALFRGLNVTIEMRHAPFYGWIHDLSAPDPSNLFTLFGLLPWNTPGWLHLGILPILYTITMIVQMRQQPTPTDPVQAKVMAWMPYMMLIFFDKMAAGFVLYWTWSNILSIMQQAYITRRHAPKEEPEKAAA